VEFLGWRDDVEALLHRWDVFVMPSLEEGFGIAALEAMAAGLPVVATAVGGIPELVKDGETGWLVPPADPQALAGRLRSLLRDSGLRQAMGIAGHSRAQDHFSMDRMVENVSKIYDGILSF
jgi:glycosyltransferase involved in cell wall biosynthesis